MQSADTLVAVARRQATIAYLSCSESVFKSLKRFENAMKLIHQHLADALSTGKTVDVLADAFELIRARNELINDIRAGLGLSALIDETATN